jgi:hypothetical protein
MVQIKEEEAEPFPVGIVGHDDAIAQRFHPETEGRRVKREGEGMAPGYQYLTRPATSIRIGIVVGRARAATLKIVRSSRRKMWIRFHRCKRRRADY